MGEDSNLGYDKGDFLTEIELNDVLRTENCQDKIYHIFNIVNLPTPRPMIVFQKSIANNQIPHCADQLIVDIS